MATSTAAPSFLDAWQDFVRQSSTFWSQAAAVPPQPPDPTQQWRQFLTLWSELWGKSFTPTSSPDVFQTAQRMWSEQLETLAQSLANMMGTEAFAAAQGKWLEQQLAWQDKLAKSVNPQFDAALRTLNLPSREQIDRLFERLVGLEDRLDDVEDDTRQILRRLRDKGAAVGANTIEKGE